MIPLLVDLDRHARERPDAVAVVGPRRALSFRELHDLVGAVAQRLRTHGVRPRQLVAVDLPAAHEWILDLALMRLATRSASIRGISGFGGLTPDVLITEPGVRRGAAPVVLEIDELWLAGASSEASGATPAVDYPRPDSIFRLMLTSGTTGTPRAAAYSVAAFEHRVLGLDRYWTDARPELNFMSLSTTGGFHTASAALRHGQAYRAVDYINEETLRFAAAQDIRVLCGSPNQIASTLQIAASHDIALATLEEIRMAGATPGSRLMRLIAERLSVPVRGVYGSTEGGGVTSRMLDVDDDQSDVGRVLPDLELQIVDESGKPVAAGVHGTVRYRGPGMTSGYFENGTVTPFPRGWFVPGDLGALSPDGTLTLDGRASEVLNVAGRKVNPEQVDERAKEFAGVRDAATFPVERESGVTEVALAVVTEPGCDLRALDQSLRRELPASHPTHFWQVSEIPRNRMGKVQRDVLSQLYERIAN